VKRARQKPRRQARSLKLEKTWPPPFVVGASARKLDPQHARRPVGSIPGSDTRSLGSELIRDARNLRSQRVAICGIKYRALRALDGQARGHYLTAVSTQRKRVPAYYPRPCGRFRKRKH
jgi:hypothetical protein